ncbi:unnamed protein product [Pneumocystis jirovecii]|uniref:Cytochrome b-c1 complex subunit 7 n=2 Tax=Pneumocystis jirovecii TaxID=42068 RepID=L0PFL2_PNEJI|nr:ubiquinol--cytochrome-c reductase subunit 7 [Pneumocystis jirovecii RU7]KTW28681.1 hypothetical protein T551_02531 [Pneumocystis jirovecii RU7]CCJ31163.1 unnamed protein product [Pneumocystis jirovecii]
MQPPTLIQTVLKYKTLATFLRPIAEGYVNLAGYRKIGLKYDDLIPEENDAMQSALKRLPKLEGYDRVYRLRIASQCSLAHTLLPEKQWVKAEEDTRYIDPILQEVVNEMNERHDLDTLILEKNLKH